MSNALNGSVNIPHSEHETGASPAGGVLSMTV